ncbi:hypothetical protein CB1_000470001 [Camelus ferus]|nr:hypothetical protein CB1_000470001 [Camelus ferus]
MSQSDAVFSCPLHLGSALRRRARKDSEQPCPCSVTNLSSLFVLAVLHSELKDAVEKQVDALPFGTEMGNEIYTDDETVRNLQEQLQLANQ